MKPTSIKTAAAKVTAIAAAAFLLAGFAFVTQTAEQQTIKALDAAVAAPGRLYAEPVQPVQMSTVVVTVKRAS